MSSLYKIPNNFIQKELVYLPAYLAGYTHSIYVNTEELLDYAEFGSLVIGLFDTNGAEVQLIGPPTKDIISGTDYRIYFDFTIDVAISGTHFFALYNESTEEVVFQSNCFNVIDIAQVEDYAFFQFRNSSNIDNYNYEVFESYNSIFLDLNAIEYDYEYELKNYYEQSTGRTRSQKINKRKFVTLEVYLFDEGAYDALFSICAHDDIKLNGEVVNIKTGISPNRSRDMNVGKGTLSFYLEKYSTVNKRG